MISGILGSKPPSPLHQQGKLRAYAGSSSRRKHLYTLADLKDQETNPSASAARPLAEAERDKRMAALTAKVSGVIIEGDAEPSRALLELSPLRNAPPA